MTTAVAARSFRILQICNGTLFKSAQILFKIFQLMLQRFVNRFEWIPTESERRISELHAAVTLSASLRNARILFFDAR